MHSRHTSTSQGASERSSRPGTSRRAVLGGAAAASTVVGLAACSSASAGGSTGAGNAPGSAGAAGSSSAPGGSSPTSSASATPQSQVSFTPSVKAGATVPVDTVVSVAASGGTISDVAMTYADNGQSVNVEGALAPDGTKWTAASLLEPGATYTLAVDGTDANGVKGATTTTFTTQQLSLKQQVFPTIVGDGSTVGIGMPVIVHFDVPVSDKASFEKHLSVTTTPQQNGAWGWVSSNEVHWRPESFWQPGTKVAVKVDINGVSAGKGIYGQKSITGGFTVGSSTVLKADLAADQLQVVQNGQVTKTIPVTGGKPGFVSRSGTKIIMDKQASLHMDAATTGIEPGDPNYYNLPAVLYCLHETYSGEYLHAAPWSVGSQGKANVSHGCIGMSTANAQWLFGIAKVGDPVIVSGTNRTLEDGNGWTDFNIPFSAWQAKSALAGGASGGQTATAKPTATATPTA